MYLEKSGNPNRSTVYDLVAVRKGNRLVNMDSAAPNCAAAEWLKTGGLDPDTRLVRSECTFGNSRFDFYVETGKGGIWVEVKGVNLEEDDVALFPDAPSERALKHVEELVEAQGKGYEAVLLFVVQMEGIRLLRPNRRMQPAFAEALLRARRAGVRILAMGCAVTETGMEISYRVPVELDEGSPEKIKQGETEAKRTEETEKSEQTETAAPEETVPEKPTPTVPVPAPEHGNPERIAPPLLAWYDENRRILPWREEPSPYRVWVSEIMLQQTRVEAVRPYFERFMAELPDFRALAEVPEDRLLKLWEGLGYYNRARNLKKAAEEVMERHGGSMPRLPAELLSLPGIGSYTAGAVASIAFGQPVPAVDGNVLRVMARYCEDGRDILNAGVRKSVEERLLRIIPRDRPGDFNQALMELGAMVCLPNGAPYCGECPLASDCLANIHGSQAEYPVKSAKKKRRVEQRTVLVIRDGQRAALCRRPDKGLLAGMYEPPSLDGHLTREEVLAFLEQKGIHALRIRELPSARHIFTHKEWHMIGYAVMVDELEPHTGGREGFLFVGSEGMQEKYPIPSAYAAYMEYLGYTPERMKHENR